MINESFMALMDKAERASNGEIIVARNEAWTIDLALMLFNWRLHVAVSSEYGFGYVHGYCYFGTDYVTALRAFSAGLEWAKGDPLHSQPPGFDKEAF